MDVLTAALNLVEDYPGGARAIAPQIGKAASTLCHELDPNYPMAKLGLHDAVKLSIVSRDPRILQAMASRLGYKVLPLPGMSAAADVPGQMMQITKEIGDYYCAFAESMSDGKVTDNELAKLRREAGETVRSILNGVAMAESNNAKLHAAAPLERVA